MQSSITTMKLTLPNATIINYDEVPVPNKSYSKLVTSDGKIAVLISNEEYWSTGLLGSLPSDMKHQLIFDSRIVLYVLSPQFRTLFNKPEPSAQNKYIRNSHHRASKIQRDVMKDTYNKFMKSIFPEHDTYYFYDIGAFESLQVEFVPRNTMFRINSSDSDFGGEKLEIFDSNTYMFA